MSMLRSLDLQDPAPERACSTTRREPEPNSRTSKGCLRSSSRVILRPAHSWLGRDDEHHMIFHKRLDMHVRSVIWSFQQRNLNVTGHQQRKHLVSVAASRCHSDERICPQKGRDKSRQQVLRDRPARLQGLAPPPLGHTPSQRPHSHRPANDLIFWANGSNAAPPGLREMRPRLHGERVGVRIALRVL